MKSSTETVAVGGVEDGAAVERHEDGRNSDGTDPMEEEWSGS